MNKPDAGSNGLSLVAAALILWALVTLSRTSGALALLDSRIAAIEARKGPAGTATAQESAEAEEEALRNELASIQSDLELASATQSTLASVANPNGTAGTPGSMPLPRTYPELVKVITTKLVERATARRVAYAKGMVETHLKLSATYSDKLAIGLGLDSEQKAKVAAIICDQVRAYEPILALEIIDEAALGEVAAIDKSIDERILAELKPEQAAKYDSIKRPWLQALVHRAGDR